MEDLEGFPDGWNGLKKGRKWKSNESSLEYKVCSGQGRERKSMHQIVISLWKVLDGK